MNAEVFEVPALPPSAEEAGRAYRHWLELQAASFRCGETNLEAVKALGYYFWHLSESQRKELPTWRRMRDRFPPRARAFIDELVALCERHGLGVLPESCDEVYSEDGQHDVWIGPFTDKHRHWLQDALICSECYDPEAPEAGRSTPPDESTAIG